MSLRIIAPISGKIATPLPPWTPDDGSVSVTPIFATPLSRSDASAPPPPPPPPPLPPPSSPQAARTGAATIRANPPSPLRTTDRRVISPRTGSLSLVGLISLPPGAGGLFGRRGGIRGR